MRLLLRLVGTLFMLTSMLGLAALGAAVLISQSPQAMAQDGQSHMPHAVLMPHPLPMPQALPMTTELQPIMPPAPPPFSTVPPPDQPRAQNVTEQLPPPGPQRITRVEIPAIGLSADVVPAYLIRSGDRMTWNVPAFKIGHAETTADAGQPGNAVLFGHVSSVHSGNVFAHLGQVDVGQAVRVFADTREFDYTVVSNSHVPRTDTSVLKQDATPAVSLITCTGVWLPTIWDYTERLVVRAELAKN